MDIGALIVDDHAEIRLLMRMIIDSANHGLFVSGEAGSGEEALALIDQLNPSVVVLDQMMPGWTGIETAIRIRSRRPELPLILCSAFLDEQARKEAQEAGISTLLPKTQISRLPEALWEAVGGR